jgi:hypothetical protein
VVPSYFLRKCVVVSALATLVALHHLGRADAELITITAPNQQVVEGNGGDIIWNIKNVSDDSIRIIGIKVKKPVFKKGELDDAVTSHTPKTIPPLPFDLPGKGDEANFVTSFTTDDIIKDMDVDQGKWKLRVRVDFIDLTTGVEEDEFGHIFVTVVDVVPEPSTLTLFGLGALGLAGYAWRRRKLVTA